MFGVDLPGAHSPDDSPGRAAGQASAVPAQPAQPPREAAAVPSGVAPRC
jgi:hypothetical protein